MSAPTSAGKKAGSRFAGLLQNNGYVALAFFATALLTLFIWFCFQMIPFGDIPVEFTKDLQALKGLHYLKSLHGLRAVSAGLMEVIAGFFERIRLLFQLRIQHGRTILRMDAFHQYGPLFGEYYERLVSGRSLLYSWDSGLGGNFLGNLFNYLSSPTGLLVVLFGHNRVPEAVGVMILLKAAFASGTFAYMLRKMFGRNDAAIAAFGVLYAFCGFFIAYYWDVMWIDAMALLPLVALGVDYVIKKQRFLLYSVSLAVTLVSNYYMGFMVCIFSVLFYLLRYFSFYDFAAQTREGRNKIANSRLLKSGFTFVFGSVLAGALAAFALAPVYFALRSSSATSSEWPAQKEWFASAFSIFDFLTNHLADVTPTIRSSGEDVLPNIYCGVATLLLVPLYFFVPSIKLREKILHAGLLALLFFSFNTRILNFVWHGKHFPNDLPYRFSFLYSFLLLLIAFRTFQFLKELSGKQILGTGVGATLFVIAVQTLGSKNVTGNGRPSDEVDLVIYLNIAFLVVYTILFFAHHRTPRTKSTALSLLLLCAVATEVCAADTNNFEITQEKYPFVYDLDAFKDVKARIEKKDGSFYRMELTDLRTRMDPSWYDYPGISTFSSMAYEKTSNLEYRLGLGGNYINSYTYNPQTPVYNAMHSLKYLIENQGGDAVLRTYKGYAYSGSSYLEALDSEYYTYMFEHQRFTVFENNYWLPVGYFARDELRGWKTTTATDPFALQAEYWELASGVAGVFDPLVFTSTTEDFVGGVPFVTTDWENQYVSYSNASALAEKGRRIPLDIHVEQTQNVYIHAGVSGGRNYVSAINVTRSDGSTENRSHDTRCIWDLGVVTPEAPLHIELQLDSEAPESAGFDCYVYAVNDAAFQEGYDFFQAHSWQIAEQDHSDTLLRGKITAPEGEDGLLYTSIPFDTGWQVTIDGKRVNPKSYVAVGDGAFLAVPLTAGMEHTVVFRFVPPGLRIGLMTSAGALVLLGLWGILLELRRRDKTPKTDGGGNPPPDRLPAAPPPPGVTFDASLPAGENLDGLLPPEGALVGDVPVAGNFPVDYPPLPPVSEAAPPPAPQVFATEGLRPEDFSLTGPVEEAPAEPPPQEERFHLTLSDPATFAQEEEPAAAPTENAAQPVKGVQAILQELQERTAALQEKVAPSAVDD